MSKRAHATDHDCTQPEHHVHDARGYLKAVEQACGERGVRLTPLRAQVLGLIAAAGKPVKAYDLLDSMKAENGSSAPPTVYRALEFLLEQGFILDDKKTVAQALKEAEGKAGGAIKITGFVRFALGEGIEKRESDFAAEVAAAAGQS